MLSSDVSKFQTRNGLLGAQEAEGGGYQVQGQNGLLSEALTLPLFKLYKYIYLKPCDRGTNENNWKSTVKEVGKVRAVSNVM